MRTQSLALSSSLNSWTSCTDQPDLRYSRCTGERIHFSGVKSDLVILICTSGFTEGVNLIPSSHTHMNLTERNEILLLLQNWLISLLIFIETVFMMVIESIIISECYGILCYIKSWSFIMEILGCLVMGFHLDMHEQPTLIPWLIELCELVQLCSARLYLWKCVTIMSCKF